MRILMVHDRLADGGGAERYVREIGEALSERGDEVAYLTAPAQAPPRADDGVYTVRPSYGWRSGRRSLAAIDRLLAALNPDLVYLHNTQELLSPVVLKTLIRAAPSVLFVHDVRLVCPNQTKRVRTTGTSCAEPVGMACLREGCCRLDNDSLTEAWRTAAIVRWRLGICRGVGRIIAPSRYIEAELVRNGFDPERITVLPYFTDRRPAARPPEPDGCLLWVGRFDGSKGFEAFAAALADLTGLTWWVVVVGDGEGLPEARRLVERLGLSPRVSFLGRLSDAELDTWYARARVVVVTSPLAESFCMVGIEAMAHGRPVVAFDVGGIREWLTNGSTGFAVPPGDIVALVAAVRLLLTEPGLSERFGKAGRVVVDARFRRSTHLAGLLPTLEASRTEWSLRNVAADLPHLRRAKSTIS